MYYVMFDFENNGFRYYLKFETEEESYRFATCLMYCDHIKNYKTNGGIIMFPRIKVSRKLNQKATCVGEAYKSRVYEWLKMGYII